MAETAVFEKRIESVDPKDLSLLEKNARYMRHEVYAQLVDNLRRDGCLSSVPFAFKFELDPKTGEVTDLGAYTVLSGNHRVRAAIDAELCPIDVMVTDTPLSRDQQVAIQLSHNSLAGEDNLGVLKNLYEEIDAIDWRAYAGLDDKTLELLDEVQVPAMSEASLLYQVIPLVFLPTELENVREAFEEAKNLVSEDEAWLVNFAEYDALLDDLAAASGAYKVTNLATNLRVILEVFRRHQDDLAEGWYNEEGDEPKHTGWVPMSSIFSTYDVPANAAQLIRKAVLRMRDHGDVSPKALWQSIELWAADYMAGE